jgi:predicted GNAT superfamily acetyltransferase
VTSLLRPITAADHGQVLAWNETNVELLSPLDEARLVTLLGWCDLGSVIHHGGTDVGFVLTFVAGTAYDSENYRWFTGQHDAFYYLDRVVVDRSVRRAGIGSRVYDEVEDRARQVAPVMCLEVNLDPPNEPSLEFHRRRGYQEVGQGVANGHVVSLLAKDL